jgi:hypothetical protein
MTLHRIITLSLCLISTLLATACDPGDKSPNDDNADESETGDPGEGNGDGDGDGEDQSAFGGDCGEETVSIIDDLGAALPGFTGTVTDQLGLIEGTYNGDFSWLPEDGPVTIEHAGTESPLTLTVTYEGGEVRLTEVELVGQPQDGELVGTCSNILEVDVTLDFVTDDGLFAESLQVPMRIYSQSDYALPGFYFSLDLAALQGELALEDFTVNEGTLSDLVLIGEFEDDNVHGSLNTEIMTMDWVGFGSVAGFGAIRQ